jgi:hypothetical protein
MNLMGFYEKWKENENLDEDCGKREIDCFSKLREAGLGGGINGWQSSHSVRFPIP